MKGDVSTEIVDGVWLFKKFYVIFKGILEFLKKRFLSIFQNQLNYWMAHKMLFILSGKMFGCFDTIGLSILYVCSSPLWYFLLSSFRCTTLSWTSMRTEIRPFLANDPLLCSVAEASWLIAYDRNELTLFRLGFLRGFHIF